MNLDHQPTILGTLSHVSSEPYTTSLLFHAMPLKATACSRHSVRMLDVLYDVYVEWLKIRQRRDVPGYI